MEEMVYLNGSLLPLNEAKISLLDYGFLFGYGIFETMRAYNGVVFRLDKHLNRLTISAKKLGIPVQTAQLKKAVEDTLKRNDLKEARVRLVVTAGEGSLTPDPKTCNRPTLLVIAQKYIPYSPELYNRGFKVIISTMRRNSQSPLPGMKTANYLESLLARQEARNSGFEDGILLNDKGWLAEASSSNIFLVNKGALRTPSLESGILPGITRAAVLELAAELKIKCFEGNISAEELMAADEAFLTNSMIEVMPIAAMGCNRIGSGQPGIITGKLAAAYREMVSKETR